jgi:uncharacterized membrane protein
LIPPPELLHALPKAQKQNEDRLQRNQSPRRTAKTLPEARLLGCASLSQACKDTLKAQYNVTKAIRRLRQRLAQANPIRTQDQT